MKKKLLILVATTIMVFAMGISVYGYEWDRNENVAWLCINGSSDWNSIYSDDYNNLKGVTWDSATNTITLNNCNINMTESDDFIQYEGSIPLNVVVKGTNTITGLLSRRDDGSTYTYNNFIQTQNYEEGDDATLNISGTGTINANNFSYFGATNSSADNWKSNINIQGISVNSNGMGLNCRYGNINIKDAKLKFDNSKKINGSSYDLITVGSNSYNADDKDGNGTLTITNSIVELKNHKDYSWYDLMSCKKLVCSGVNIYAGATGATAQYSASSLLSKKTYGGEQEATYSPADNIGYVLFTTNKLNLSKAGTSGKTASVSKPSKVKSLKAVNKKGKKVKLTWKRVSGAAGYQIMYGRNKKMTKSKKVISTKSTSKTIKKLTKKKTYYFKVRAYKVSGGKNIYGSWSSVKKAKIKK